MMNKCYGCKWKKSIPGNTHVSCTNENALVRGEEAGIRNGWFFHPFNFDPVWLVECDGFEEVKPNEQS